MDIKQDFFHRFIQVPRNYDKAYSGTFNLYYEICKDFDSAKPTVMVPSDGQMEESIVGRVDAYRKSVGPDVNIVTFQYRGKHNSKIEINDWEEAAEILSIDQAIEDIESVRIDLLGDRPMYLWGGSGLGIMGLKYLSRYHKNVSRALLFSISQDAKGLSEAGNTFFLEFLHKFSLEQKFRTILSENKIDKRQFMYVLQRLLYSNQQKANTLIKKMAENDFSLFQSLNDETGQLSEEISKIVKDHPDIAVWMFETNIPKDEIDGIPDINFPFVEMGRPLFDLAEKGIIKNNFLTTPGLEKVSTEVLLVAGEMDQVTPEAETLKIHQQLPSSTHLLFRAYHSLMDIPQCRNEMSGVFFKDGTSGVKNILSTSPCKEFFIR